MERAATSVIGGRIEREMNKTGADSKYLRKLGKYTCVGAYQSEESPYQNWY